MKRMTLTVLSILAAVSLAACSADYETEALQFLSGYNVEYTKLGY